METYILEEKIKKLEEENIDQKYQIIKLSSKIYDLIGENGKLKEKILCLDYENKFLKSEKETDTCRS